MEQRREKDWRRRGKRRGGSRLAGLAALAWLAVLAFEVGLAGQPSAGAAGLAQAEESQGTGPSEAAIAPVQTRWWTTQRVGLALVGAGVSVLVAVGFAVALHGRVRKQTEVIRQNLEREAALEKRYREWFEDANDIIYTLDLAGNFTSVNRAGLRVTGYTAEEVRSMNLAQVVAPDYLPMVQEEIARKLKGEPARPYEIQVLTKSGQRVDLEVHTRLIVQDGKPVGIHGIARDISERKRAEKRSAVFSRLGYQLSEAHSAEQAARVVLAAADELLGWDACSLTLVSADRTRDKVVVSIDTVGGKRVDVAPGSDQPTPMALRVLRDGPQLILRDGLPEEKDELMRFGDKQRRSASLMFVPIRHGSEGIGMMTIQSYTPRAYDQKSLETLQALADHCGGAMHRLQVEAARRESEARKMAILESTLDCVITVDQSGKIMECNSATQKTFGYPPAELTGKPLGEWLIALAFREGFQEGLMSCLTTGKSHWPEQRVEMKAVRSDRREFPVELAITRIPGEGPPACTVVVRDITERLNLEAQLRHAHRLESVGQLAAGVAHDFNNILGIIQGYASLLLLQKDGSGDIQGPLQEICGAVERAANLTRQLLTFSRKQLMRPQVLDLGSVVSNLVRLLQRVIGEDIALQFNYPGALPPIYADLGMMEQVVMNLAVNARDAMPHGGRLAIGVAPVVISPEEARRNPEARPGRFVCLSVADTGCGMDERILGRLFEPFFTTKEVGKGTGLGLATIYGIVKQHEGWIEVTSQVGRGTTFKVFLPVCDQRGEAAAPSPERATVVGGQETVLLVEDEPALRDVAGRALRRYGYQVLVAANGAEALEVWREHGGRVDLLVTDVVMPAGISGTELASQLRAQAPGLKVLYTSGYSWELTRQSVKLPAECKFLAKPYSPSALAAAARACLDGKD